MTQVENGKVRSKGGVRAIAETTFGCGQLGRVKIVVSEFPLLCL